MSDVGQWDPAEQSSARGVAVQGGYACVADAGAGLWVIDVSDPASPVDIGHWDPAGQSFTFGVTMCGTYAYVADYDAGFWIIELGY